VSEIKKHIGIWLAVAVLIGAAFGGGYLIAQMSEEQTSTGNPYLTVIDGEGRIVALPDVPERIIVLTPGYAETLYAIGCGDKIVAVDNGTAEGGYPAEVHQKPTVGKAWNPSLEKIIEMDPDLVIAYPYSADAISSLEEKIPIYYVAYEKSLEDVMEGIRTAGLLTGHISEADNVVSDMQMHIDEIVDKTEGLNRTMRPLVYFETSSVVGKCAGPDTEGNDLIYKAGGINIAADEPTSYPILSTEYIIEKNPDVILIQWYTQTTVDDLKNRSGWDSINAVKNDRVYKLSEISGVGPRAWMVLEEMAHELHPELFSE